jgi:hypothetical protein
MNFDGLRLELAEHRVRMGALERRVEWQNETIKRLTDLVERLVMPSLERAGETESKHALIRALARFFEAGNTETRARHIERACGLQAVPPGAKEIVARLRAAYGRGGPSRPTIRRALSKFSCADENGSAAASCTHLNCA